MHRSFTALLLGILFLFVAPASISAASVDVSGKAAIVSSPSWYITFNGNTVKIDNQTGVFSGHAFSDDLGTVVFGGTAESNSAGPVTVNLTTGAVSGKAKFLTTGGYLDFDYVNGSFASNVTLNITSGAFSGHAWSVDNGWIDFSDTGVFATLGFRLTNVDPALMATTASDWSTSVDSSLQLGTGLVGIKHHNFTSRIAELDINFAANIDWTGVTGGSSDSIAFMHFPNGVSAATGGASTSYTLYVIKGEGDEVLICPGATSLGAVVPSCTGGFYLHDGETLNGATAHVVTADTTTYWKISGLTGTGAMSLMAGLKDTMSRLKVATAADHQVSFGTNNGILASGDSFTLTFPGFDLSNLVLSDIQLSDTAATNRTLAATPATDTWGVTIDNTAKTVVFLAPTDGQGYYPPVSRIFVDFNNGHMINPDTVGSHPITITIDSATPEEGTLAVAIVDSDQVNVTGFVNTFISFDIDTGLTDNVECSFNACLIHEHGAAGSNYTVDLGELSAAWINKSQSASVMHSDGNNGIINSIYFDLTTNAWDGAIVTVNSQNGGLARGSEDIINSVTNGQTIAVNSNLYGFTLPTAGTGNGTVIRNSNCDNGTNYCALPTVLSGANTVFSTNGAPLDYGRLRMDLAAATGYTNRPGVYTDTLTFIATATY